MDSTTIGLLIALVVLIVMSGFFSATETAYTSFSTVRMRALAEKKRTARVALKLSEDYNKVLTTLLIGNNIVNIAAATISTVIFVNLLGAELGPTISTIALTAVLVVFSEITPKSLAKEAPETFACIMAYPLLVCWYLFMPLNFIFGLWKKFIFWLFRLNKKKPTFTEQEFKMLVSDIQEEGVIDETDEDLITKTLRYGDLHVGSCMIPLDRVVMVEAREDMRSVFKIFRETNFSRVPVYKGTRPNIIGILYRADFYENMLAGRRDFTNIIRPVSRTVPEMKVADLMKRMQSSREHMMIVGPAGNSLGLITREDMVEELVGDIDDKYDLTPVTSPLTPFIPEPEEENGETREDEEE